VNGSREQGAPPRRRFLIGATGVVGALGLAGLLVPFVESMLPSEKARLAGGPLEVDFSKLEPGAQLSVPWRGKPIWVLRRTPEMLERLNANEPLLRDPASRVTSQQPSYCQNLARSIKPEYFICIGICTHLGCVPNFRPEVAPPDLGPEWPGGYFCPCHGSRFDLAGRVFKGVPAPTNLVIPRHRYIADTVIVLGQDPA